MKKYHIRKGSPIWWTGIITGFVTVVSGAYSWMLLISASAGAL